MTHKHYREAAQIIRETRPSTVCPECQICIGKDMASRYIAFGLASMFQADNPRFSRDKFLAACGIDQT